MTLSPFSVSQRFVGLPLILLSVDVFSLAQVVSAMTDTLAMLSSRECALHLLVLELPLPSPPGAATVFLV